MRAEAMRLEGGAGASSNPSSRHLSIVKETKDQGFKLAYGTWSFLEEQSHVKVEYEINDDTLLLKAQCLNAEHATRVKINLFRLNGLSADLSGDTLNINISDLARDEIIEFKRLFSIKESSDLKLDSNLDTNELKRMEGPPSTYRFANNTRLRVEDTLDNELGGRMLS